MAFKPTDRADELIDEIGDLRTSGLGGSDGIYHHAGHADVPRAREPPEHRRANYVDTDAPQAHLYQASW